MKQRPSWQAGFLNGIGGEVKDAESPEDAMKRTFSETTGAGTWWQKWERFAILHNEGRVISCFRMNREKLPMIHHRGDETVSWWKVRSVIEGKFPTLPDLAWLIPLAEGGEGLGAMVTLQAPASALGATAYSKPTS
ncbi:hypothetical protein [Verrucomicrobium sp. BvORR106]|uniref:hypothetical protein n=1 Tax=Verrucomicrobium sp. BvORR106 TaxID=1403819 RepID=UPI0022410381|nr:hypothetical protein [Verrucomicrobium sp. BvORR106]